MNLNFRARRITAEPNGYKEVTVDAEDVEESEILDQIDLKKVIEHFGKDVILNEIGEEEVMDHFDLTKIEE